MGANDNERWVPEHLRAWLRSLGFSLPLAAYTVAGSVDAGARGLLRL